jgi:hypothetical protein
MNKEEQLVQKVRDLFNKWVWLNEPPRRKRANKFAVANWRGIL